MSLLNRNNTALNNVNVSKKINEMPQVPTNRSALGDIGNKLGDPATMVVGKKVSSRVDETKQWQKTMDNQPRLQSVSEQLRSLELSESFSQSQLSIIENIDDGDEKNPQLVSEWVNDIYDYLRDLETKHRIWPAYLGNNKEIKPKMRGLLIDWLSQVHNRYHMQQETLYLTVSIIDRVLQVLEINRTKLQLVGVTAMLIAAKYEEMYAPEIDDFIYVTDNAYKKPEIKQMEIVILKTLDFALGRPVPPHFLRRNSKAGGANSRDHALAKYIMELTLVRYEMAHLAPSLIAAAAFFLSIKLLRDASWTQTLIHYSGYTQKELMPVVQKLALFVVEAEKSEHQTVRIKYASERLGRVALMKCLKSETVLRLAAAARSRSFY